MVVIQLNGGLGNQLFQYAAAKQIANLNETDLWIDIHNFGNNISKYELSVFNLNPLVADDAVLKLFHGDEFSKRERFLTKIVSFGKYNKYNHDNYGFDKQFLELRGNFYIRGIFQSELFFSKISEIIIKEFQILQEHLPTNKELINQIQTTNSVSVHIRKSDYFHNLTTMNAHGICSKDFYLKSINNMIDMYGKDLHFFIFTDNANWIINEMKWQINYTLIENEPKVHDLYLMSLCKHNIIANNALSWWAAWLNLNNDKHVIMPKHWINNLASKSIDIVPVNWLVK